MRPKQQSKRTNLLPEMERAGEVAGKPRGVRLASALAISDPQYFFPRDGGATRGWRRHGKRGVGCWSRGRTPSKGRRAARRAEGL